MELIEKKCLPDSVELGGRIVGEWKQCVGELGRREQFLQFAVVALCPRLNRERAAMQFEIELAAPGRQLGRDGG